MSEYEQFRAWSRAAAERLAADPARQIAYLCEVHALAGDLLEVCDALHEISRGSPWELWRRARQYARLAPDPLRFARARMRAIRRRYEA